MVSKLFSWMWERKEPVTFYQTQPVSPCISPSPTLYTVWTHLHCSSTSSLSSTSRLSLCFPSTRPGDNINSQNLHSYTFAWECREPSCKRSPFQSDLSNLWFHLICSAAPAIQKLRYNSINLVFSSEIQVFEILMGSAILHFCQRRDNIYLIPAPKWSSAS